MRGGHVDLIGHSMGGLVARVDVQCLGGARRVDRCITLGKHHQGPYNAYGVPTRVGRQLRPDSTLIARVEGTRAAAAEVALTSIVAGSDPIVIPRVFGHDGPGAEDAVHVPHIGYIGLLSSPMVYRTVLDRLRRGVPPRVAAAPPPPARRAAP